MKQLKKKEEAQIAIEGMLVLHWKSVWTMSTADKVGNTI